MSLRVWLPLNGTLDNQGLDDVVVTDNGTTVDDNGKIGKCCSFNGTSSFLNLSPTLMADFTECSICFWLKINAWKSSYETYFQAGKNAYSWTDYIFGILRNGANSTICFTIGNGSSASNASYLTSARTVGEWCHISFIYSPGKCKIYLNGILDKEYTTTFVPDFTKITKITIGRSNGNAYQTNCSMNDFRIYDHALSPMEVKQLSQGLILHYPLNRGGFGADNILLNTHFDSRYIQSTGWDTTKNGTQLASSWGGYNAGVSNSSTVYHAHLKEFNGEWVYEYIKTASESWLGISQGGLNSKLIAGKTYTFSWEEYRVEGNNYPTGGLYYFKTGATSANFHLGQFGGSHGNVLGKWRKFSYTFVAPTNGDYSKNMSWYIYGTSGGNGKMYIRHLKLEEGSIATPWCPNSSDILITTMGLNNNIQYDTNGYGNNGTKTGTFSYSSDTPKYNVSTIFNGSNYIEAEPLPDETKTISVWVNYQTLPTGSDYSGFIMFDKNTQISICVYSGGQYLITYIGSSKGGTGSRVITSFQTNKWYHIVVLKTDTTTREVYINGVKATPSGTNYWSGDLNKLLIGTRHAAGVYKDGAHAKICDFRAYTTLLSPQDILSLYHNEAYIDNNGNIYGAVYEEEG